MQGKIKKMLHHVLNSLRLCAISWGMFWSRYCKWLELEIFSRRDTSYLVTTILFVSLSIQLAPGGALTGLCWSSDGTTGGDLPSCVESRTVGKTTFTKGKYFVHLDLSSDSWWDGSTLFYSVQNSNLEWSPSFGVHSQWRLSDKGLSLRRVGYGAPSFHRGSTLFNVDSV